MATDQNIDVNFSDAAAGSKSRRPKANSISDESIARRYKAHAGPPPRWTPLKIALAVFAVVMSGLVIATSIVVFTDSDSTTTQSATQTGMNADTTSTGDNASTVTVESKVDVPLELLVTDFCSLTAEEKQALGEQAAAQVSDDVEFSGFDSDEDPCATSGRRLLNNEVAVKFQLRFKNKNVANAFVDNLKETQFQDSLTSNINQGSSRAVRVRANLAAAIPRVPLSPEAKSLRRQARRANATDAQPAVSDQDISKLQSSEQIEVLMAMVLRQQEQIAAQKAELISLTSRVANTTGPEGPRGPAGADGTCYGVLGQSRHVAGGTVYRWKNRAYSSAGVSYWEVPSAIRAKVGDVIEFSHTSDGTNQDVWLFPDRESWETCDFSWMLPENKTWEQCAWQGNGQSGNTPCAGEFRGNPSGNYMYGRLSDGRQQIRSGKPAFNFTITPQHAQLGKLYFGTAGCNCQIWPCSGCVPLTPEKIGQNHCANRKLKIEVDVTDMNTVLVAGSGGSGVDAAAQSATVLRLKGKLEAMARVNIMQQMQFEERVRTQGSSGITVIRGYENGLNAYDDGTYARTSFMAIHNHANNIDTIGMGETKAVLNGVEFQTRHNDYSMKMPHRNSTRYNDAEPTPLPGVPPEVTNLATVEEQIVEMREWFRAWQTQNWTVRDYRQYFKPTMSVLEGTWILSTGDLEDPFESDRHTIEARTWSELHNKIRYLYNSGRKNNRENIAVLPSSIRRMVNGSEPEIANWEYRIINVPINHDIPLERFRVATDLHVQLHRSPKTREELFWKRSARFELNPAISVKDCMPQELTNGTENTQQPGCSYPFTGENCKIPWRLTSNSWNYLDYLMEQVPGKDGYRGNLTDIYEGSSTMHWCHSDQPLNAAFYSRYYNVDLPDAMGQNSRRRGFHDANLWSARTSYDIVSKLEVDDPVPVDPDCNPATGNCDVMPRYREQAWSYAIPLEIVWTTPLTAWNPYDLFYLGENRSKPPVGCNGEDNTVARKNAETLIRAGGKNGRTDSNGDCTVAKAFNCISSQFFYQTPAEFFLPPVGADDPADTSGRATCVLDQTGVPRKVFPSGHWIVFPSIPTVGPIRQRYPIAPIHEHGNTAWKEIKAVQTFQKLVPGGEYETKPDGVFGDARDANYGFTLTLAGGSHDHDIVLNPSKLRQWTRNEDKAWFTGFEVKAGLANGHEHTVRITRNRTDTTQPYQYWLRTCALKGDESNAMDYECSDGHHAVVRL